jgi:hypothetical protein
MEMKRIGVVSSVAWLAVALSYAPPADALVFANYTGSYAACASSYTTSPGTFTCTGGGQTYNYSYRQMIKLAGSNCNTGVCSSDGYVNADVVYSVGRKPVTVNTGCTNGVFVLALGSCAC